MLFPSDLVKLANAAGMAVVKDRQGKTLLHNCDACFERTMIKAFDKESFINACICGHREERKEYTYYLDPL